MLFLRPRKSLVVIATNNGTNVLPNCLASLSLLKPYPKVVIVDTGSTDPDFKNWTQNWLKHNPNVQYDEAPGTYDSGAYIHIAKKVSPDTVMMCCQDSIEFKSENSLGFFLKKIKNADIVSWAFFPIQWGSVKERAFALEATGLSDWKQVESLPSTCSIFGPIFMTTAGFIQEAISKNVLRKLPTNKAEQQGMERAWGIIATLLNKKHCSLNNMSTASINDFPELRKTFQYRG